MIPTALVTAAFVFARLSALCLMLPPLSTQGIPKHVPVMLSLAVTAIVAPLVEQVPDQGLAFLLSGLVVESLIGLSLGFIVRTAFGALSTAGEIVTQQAGFGIASALDPVNHTSEGTLGTLLSMLGAAAFVGAGLHGRCIELAAESFTALPPGGALVPVQLAGAAVIEIRVALELGVQLGAPFLVGGFALNCTISVLARLAPKMNAFLSIGLTASSILGLLLLGASIPAILHVFAGHVHAVVDAMAGLLP